MKKSDKNIILMLIGILLAAAAYFLGYQKLTAETEVIQQANAVLAQEVAYLQELADNKQQYIDDTESMLVKIEEIKAEFPAKYLPEDQILYMIDREKSLDVFARSIAMNQTAVVDVPMPVQEAPIIATEGAPVEEGAEAVSTEGPVAPAILLYRTPTNVAIQSSYKSLKDLIKFVNDDENRKSIDNITASFDSTTGELVSTIDISMYSLTGTEAEYTKPTVSGVAYGTSDIFNTAQKKAAAAAQSAPQQ